MKQELTITTGVKETEKGTDFKRKLFTSVSCIKAESAETIADMLSIYLWKRSDEETKSEKELANKWEKGIAEKYGATFKTLYYNVCSHRVIVSMAIALGGSLPKGIDAGNAVRTCRERCLKGDFSTVSDTLNEIFGLSEIMPDDKLYIKRTFKVSTAKAETWFNGRMAERHKATTVKVKGGNNYSAISDKSITVNHFYTELMLLACLEMGMPLKQGKAIVVLPKTADRSIFK